MDDGMACVVEGSFHRKGRCLGGALQEDMGQCRFSISVISSLRFGQ